jgi:hypothetical protein
MKFINHTWQLYFVGLVFGIGFDTATEVVLLSATAYAAIARCGLASAVPATRGLATHARARRGLASATAAELAALLPRLTPS